MGSHNLFHERLIWKVDIVENASAKECVRQLLFRVGGDDHDGEKELPDAFLRRCIFHYIDFPSQELMEEIVRVHFPDVEEHLLKNAMEVFYNIRSIRDIRKKPSTSELIDWINALQIGGISADTLREKLPFVGVVVKKDEDLETVKNM